MELCESKRELSFAGLVKDPRPPEQGDSNGYSQIPLFNNRLYAHRRGTPRAGAKPAADENRVVANPHRKRDQREENAGSGRADEEHESRDPQESRSRDEAAGRRRQ